jgi:hypothetical protein
VLEVFLELHAITLLNCVLNKALNE